MSPDVERGHHERTPLLAPSAANRRLSRVQADDGLTDRRLSRVREDGANSIISSAVSKEEAALAGSTVGERLPYNDYTTIDHLHDLVGTLRSLLLRIPSS